MKKFILLLSILCMVSCNTSDEPLVENLPNPEEVGRIVDLLQSFRASVSNSGRSDIANLNIRNIKRDFYRVRMGKIEKIIPDSRSTEPSDSTFSFVTVTFESNGSEGYALLTDETPRERVYYITENGHLNDTIDNPVLCRLLNVMPEIAAQDLSIPPITPPIDPPFPLIHYIGPLLHTAWGQGEPYNWFAEPCRDSQCGYCHGSGVRPPIGCTIVATAQVIAYCQRFKHVLYGTRTMDFQRISSMGHPETYADSLHIAHLMHTVALNCGVIYRHDGTGSLATLKGSKRYLDEIGYITRYEDGALNVDSVRANLLNQKPHLVSGSGIGGAHSWVIDGMRYEVSGTWVELHCNWGWDGSSNGWSAADPFEVDDYMSYANLYILGYNE